MDKKLAGLLGAAAALDDDDERTGCSAGATDAK